MITRVISPAVRDGGGNHQEPSSSGQTRVAPDEILRQAHATSLAGIFHGIALVAEHSFEIFQELKDESARLGERVQRIQLRVNVLAQLTDPAATCDNQDYNNRASLIDQLPTREESDQVLNIPEISFSNYERHCALRKAYEQCATIPALEVLDTFYQSSDSAVPPTGPDEQEQESAIKTWLSRKKYSNPDFFVDEWMKKETLRQQQVLQKKQERRKERRELKRGASHSLSLQSQQQRQQHDEPSESTTPASEGTAGDLGHHEPSKSASGSSNKFLKIRSWREIYGTGEGKELATRGRHQDVKARSSSKNVLSGVDETTEESTHAADLPSPPSQSQGLSLIRGPDDLETAASNTQQAYAPLCDIPPPPPPPPLLASVRSSVCSGAFMQEIDDDDEIFTELLHDPPHDVNPNCNFPPEMTNGIAQAASGSHMPESDEFIDHGLSYYYDPTSSMHHLVPPPPPPPPPPSSNVNAEALDNDSEFYDCEEEGSFMEASPPPPPPPLPPSELTAKPNKSSDEKALCAVKEARPPSGLLLQIQLGVASLRHVDIDEDSDAQEQWPPRREAPSVQATLLEQIKMKQRTLRPVEPQSSRRPSLSRSTAAPFAVSIARILERRSVIAYDSDSGGDEEAHVSENDW